MSIQRDPENHANGKLVVNIEKGQIQFYLKMKLIHRVDLREHVPEVAIREYLKCRHHLSIDDHTAEEMKMRLGCAFRDNRADDSMNVAGCDLQSGLPKTICIAGTEISDALHNSVSEIIQAIRNQLIRCPSQDSAEIIVHGIELTGSGASLRGLDKLIQEETAIPVLTSQSSARE